MGDTYAARFADLGEQADAELARAWADSPRMRPAPDRPGLQLLLEEDFTNGLPPELSCYGWPKPPDSHPGSAWWAKDRWCVREPGVLSLDGWRAPAEAFPAEYRTQAPDGGRLVTAGGGLWLPSARWPEATAEAWGTAPAKAGKARGLLYGRVEFRVRMEAGDDVGMVLWLYPADDRRKWPTGTEIDVYENGGGGRQEITATLHYGPSREKRRRELRPYAIDATRWHTVALEWWPGLLVGYVDDVEVWRIESPAVPSWHMIPGAQTEALAVQPGTGPAPSMHLGGIRVWQATPEAIAERTPSPTLRTRLAAALRRA